MEKKRRVVIRIENGDFYKRMEARQAVVANENFNGVVKCSDSTSVEYDEDLNETKNNPMVREFYNSLDLNVVMQINSFGFEARFEYTEYWNGYQIYKSRAGYPSISCREHDQAIEVIKELLKDNDKIDVRNQYETFYGCGWFNWLMKEIGDIATAEVLDTWDAWGDCAPYPSTVRLTRIAK